MISRETIPLLQVVSAEDCAELADFSDSAIPGGATRQEADGANEAVKKTEPREPVLLWRTRSRGPVSSARDSRAFGAQLSRSGELEDAFDQWCLL